MFARLVLNHEGKRSVAEQLVSSANRDVALGGGAEPISLERAGFFDDTTLGIEHNLTASNHLAFVLGFVLISRGWRDLALVITGFTLGYSVTFAIGMR